MKNKTKKTFAIVLSIFLMGFITAATLVSDNISVTKERKTALVNANLGELNYSEENTNGDNYIKVCIWKDDVMTKRCSHEFYDINNQTAINEIRQLMINKLADDVNIKEPVIVVEKQGTLTIE